MSSVVWDLWSGSCLGTIDHLSTHLLWYVRHKRHIHWILLVPVHVLGQHVWKYNPKCVVHRRTSAWGTFVVMPFSTMLQHNNSNNVVIEMVLLSPTLLLLLLSLLCRVLLSGKSGQDLLWKPLRSPALSKHTYCGKYITKFIFIHSSWYQYISCAKMSGSQISNVPCVR